VSDPWAEVQPPDGETIRTEVGAAIEEVLRRHGEFTTKWLVVVESVGPDNLPGLWLATTKGAKPWDTLGMLDFACELERSEITHRQREG
jgi:hypothetical protein